MNEPAFTRTEPYVIVVPISVCREHLAQFRRAGMVVLLAGPRKLCIDGHAYHRRQVARKRRK